jgi:hypothetical protein
MSSNTGGPAFPVPGLHENNDYDGMTLRDYFAAKAMQAMIPLSGVTPQTAASVAYTFAAAMLKEREK